MNEKQSTGSNEEEPIRSLSESDTDKQDDKDEGGNDHLESNVTETTGVSTEQTAEARKEKAVPKSSGKAKVSTKKWYVVRTYSGQEAKTLAYLESQLKDSELKEKFGEIIIPTEKVPTISESGKKRVKTRNFMPGYVMIEAEMDDRVKAFILSVPSIISFVGPKGNPSPLRPDEVGRLKGRIEEYEERPVTEVPFKVSDKVKVIGGPFSTFKGEVSEVNEEKMKLKVTVTIFGRPTPVELSFSEVEKEK
jgi:transcriptional antiterminator NusG